MRMGKSPINVKYGCIQCLFSNVKSPPDRMGPATAYPHCTTKEDLRAGGADFRKFFVENPKNPENPIDRLAVLIYYIQVTSLRDGVMVAQEILDLLVWVRALVPEPFFCPNHQAVGAMDLSGRIPREIFPLVSFFVPCCSPAAWLPTCRPLVRVDKTQKTVELSPILL